MWSWKKVIKKKYKRVYWVQSFTDSVFLLSSMAIFLWHKTMLSRFEVFPFVASPDSWLPSSVLASATSIPFFRNRISFSSSYTTSFVCLANSSFTLASFICSSTFLCCSRNAPYLSLALSHDLNKFCVTLLFSILPLWMIKSLTSANMVSSLVEYPWMLNKLLLMGNPCFCSTFAWGKKEHTQQEAREYENSPFLTDLSLLIPRMEAIAKREIFHIHILPFEVSFSAFKKKSSLVFLVEK